ncbi:MAG: hypothetical protein WC712_09745 [Candidatus Brocadiia bacterium]
MSLKGLWQAFRFTHKVEKAAYRQVADVLLHGASPGLRATFIFVLWLTFLVFGHHLLFVIVYCVMLISLPFA